jgi:Leucine-rich repeat (LRR) protein
MFSHRYTLNLTKYTSHKTNKVLLFVFKNKNIPKIKFDNYVFIFECEKNEFIKINNILYKITRKTYLGLIKKCIVNNTLFICNINKLASTIKYLNYLHDVRFLDIWNTKLTYIPKSIGKLTNLQSLRITWNELLIHISKSIGKLSNLLELDISINKLKHFPKSIGNLNNFKILNI